MDDDYEDSSGKLTLRMGMRFPLAFGFSWKIKFSHLAAGGGMEWSGVQCSGVVSMARK